MNQTAQQLTDTHSQLATARNILAATGKSPRQLGDESRRKVIEWLYHWGYTSSTLIQLLLGRTTGGYAQKLAKQGWLTVTKTASGSPAAYFTLSEQGLQEAERFSDMLFRYSEIDNYKVNQPQIRHNLIAQAVTINGLHARSITRYETERMFTQAGDKSGVKRPDVAWYTQTGLIIAVEIELSAKWARDLDEFVLGISKALTASEGSPARYDRFAIISDSPAIIQRYIAAMQPNADLPVWKKNQRGHWVIDTTEKVPDCLINKIDFRLLEE